MSGTTNPLRNFLLNKRARVAHVSRYVSSIFVHGAKGLPPDYELPPSSLSLRLTRDLMKVLAGSKQTPKNGAPSHVPSHAFTTLRPPQVLEAFLAFFLLRSIELEMQAEQPSTKLRRIDEGSHRESPLPLFQLPCPEAELCQLFRKFCVKAALCPVSGSVRELEAFRKAGLATILPRPQNLLEVLESCVPVSPSDDVPLCKTANVAHIKRIYDQAGPGFISSVLALWERRHIVILSGARAGQSDLGVILESISIQGLTRLLTRLLHSLASQGVQLPHVDPAISIYKPRKLPTPSAPSVPSETRINTPASEVQQMIAVSTTLERMDAADKLAPSANVSAQSAAQIVSEPTVLDLLAKTYLLPPRTDIRFDLLRFCQHASKEACRQARRGAGHCALLHYRRIVQSHTDVSLGDCSYLDTCRHIQTCKYVHYAVDLDAAERRKLLSNPTFRHRVVLLNHFDVLERSTASLRALEPPDGTGVEPEVETWLNEGIIALKGTGKPCAPQWIRCDIRSLHLGIFRGLVSVVMADPPWDIRMDLPYGTMTDSEMKNLRVDLIQEEGLLFLWVTGRAMEIARDCLAAWGYKRMDELVWAKTNHLHRIIRTGRTGHWLNHSKEHCLIGVKGNPKLFTEVDCDVIVSEVRETSRKPDEVYRLIERLCPYGLKLELFGRQHNLRHNWITLGNQLDGVQLHTPQLVKAFTEHAGGKKQVVYEEQQRIKLAVSNPDALLRRENAESVKVGSK